MHNLYSKNGYRTGVQKISTREILQNTFVTPSEQVLVAHRTSAVRSAVPETSVVCFGWKLYFVFFAPVRPEESNPQKFQRNTRGKILIERKCFSLVQTGSQNEWDHTRNAV